MRAVSVLGLACLGAGLLLPAHAFAQAHATPPEAVQFFESAREHYRRGRYPEAAVDLERAVMLDPTSPTLRYNLGRVYELLGQLPEARAQYARYLELLPPEQEEERERTRATLRRLDGAIASGAVAPPAEPEAEQEPLRELEGPVVVRERGVADEVFWITLGSGVAALVASAVTGGLALDRAAARDGLVLTDPGQLDAFHATYDALDAEAQALGVTTDVLLGVGGAALVASVLLFVLREREVEREIVRPARRASIEPFVLAGPGATMLGVRGAL
ncbi:MAG TPA: tetratricopeptide repeat protein [Sandaracinaceae bacterium]